MTSARFDADFARIFADHEPLCPAQKEVESGNRHNAAAGRFPALNEALTARPDSTKGDEANV